MESPLSYANTRFIIWMSVCSGIGIGAILLTLRTIGLLPYDGYSYTDILCYTLMLAVFYPAIQILVFACWTIASGDSATKVFDERR